MNKTGIEWCDLSSNPLKYRHRETGKVVWACIKKSPGCAHCYAEQLAHRYGRGGPFSVETMRHLDPFLDDKELRHILRAKVPAGSRCFVGDMTDLFGDWVSDAMLDQLFAVFALRRDITFQLLTKRPVRMWEYLTDPHRSQGIHEAIKHRMGYHHPARPAFNSCDLPLPNVWLGTSVEDQAAADERIPYLLATPAAVRFLSCEPLLGPVDLSGHINRYLCGYDGANNPQNSRQLGCWKCSNRARLDRIPDRLHWIIAGGESGPGSRPFELDWARSIQNQCDAAGVPWFMKQAGSAPRDWDRGDAPNYRPPEVVPLRLRDRKGGDLSELPTELRVRQFPEPVGG